MFHRSFCSVLALAAVAAPLTAQRTEVYMTEPRSMSTTVTTSRRAIIGVTVTTRPSAGDTLGATIAAVTPGGPAAKAGILAGDIITKFNGTALAERRTRTQGEDEVPSQSGPGLKLIELVSRVAPGDTVTVEWRHERSRKTARLATESAGNLWVSGDSSFRFYTAPPPGAYTFELDLADRQREMVELRRGLEMHGFPAPGIPGERVFLRMRGPLGGVQFAPINADLGRYFGVTEGILVLDTPDTSAHVDFRGGDVILAVDGRKPTGVEQLMRILGSYNDSETVNFEVMRDKRRVTVAVKAEDVRGGGRMRVMYDRVPSETPAPTTAPRSRVRSGT